MRRIHFHLLAMAMLMLAPCERLLAADVADDASTSASETISDEANDEVDSPSSDDELYDIGHYDGVSYDGNWIDNTGLECDPVACDSLLAARLGMWGVYTRGSRTGVGEYFGLDQVSPFYDIDGLFTNGIRTLDFSMTGPENEANAARMKFFGPMMSADVDYSRFIHRLGHDPLSGWRVQPTPPAVQAPPTNYAFWGEDLNVNDENAIRVQTLDAKFRGNVTENLEWYLNVWSINKEGMRQANGVAHCTRTSASTTSYCHNVARGQQIDWFTGEITPGLTARFDGITVDYSRTMRAFQQSDEIVQNNYQGSGFSPLGPPFPPPAINAALPQFAAYAWVPENYTEIDRIKSRIELGAYTDLYVLGFLGNTHNNFRDTDRKFFGGDVRLTNRSYENFTLTSYAKTNSQENELPPYALNAVHDPELMREGVAPAGSTNTAAWDLNGDGLPDYLNKQPVDRTDYALGARSRWIPFMDYGDWRKGTSIMSGYEWSEINRRYVTYELEAGEFTQPNTVSHTIDVGVSQDWNPWFNTTARYIWRNNNYPLIGVTPSVTAEEFNTYGAALTSALPEHEDIVETSATWSPTENLFVNGTLWLENTYNHTEFARFEEDRYPFVLSAFYAPNSCWTVSGGYANFTNWIDQDVTLGGAAEVQAHQGANIERDPSYSRTVPWRYSGEADVVNLAVTRVVTSRFRVNGGFEFTRGNNEMYALPNIPITWIPVPPAGGGAPQSLTVNYDDIPSYSRDAVNLYRWAAGVDYDLTSNMSTYVRYNFYDWDDVARNWNSGTSHMLLGGVSGTF